MLQTVAMRHVWIVPACRVREAQEYLADAPRRDRGDIFPAGPVRLRRLTILRDDPKRRPQRLRNCALGHVSVFWIYSQGSAAAFFASAPSASSATLLKSCKGGPEPGRRLSSQTALADSDEYCSEPARGSVRALLTVPTVFSRDVRILITRLPARPSRLNVISIPSARRNVCARRKWPARARGFFGQPVLSPV